MASFAPSSLKWVSSSGEGRLVVNSRAEEVLRPVWNSPTNLISIFGRARQGKSFLMNCLAGESSIFKISNEKESCTQGIDLSSKFIDLETFSGIDGGEPLPRRGSQASSARSCVGFVDAEGQGDKDVSYDANLICPILLTSKCVIFNWKGDLQKDHILSTLGIMTRAAQNVQSVGTTSKFGHLHIVFRDWQAVGSSEADAFSMLFDAESSRDAATRNQIRRDVLQAFQSVQVWLFEAPTERVSDLKRVLSIDMCTRSFRQQVRNLRNRLSMQLRDPTICGAPLTGRLLCGMLQSFVETLNRGEVVLPSSAYLSLIKEELRVWRDAYEMELRNQMNLAVEELDDVQATALFPGFQASEKKLEARLAETDRAFGAKLETAMASTGDNEQLRTLRREFEEHVLRARHSCVDHYIAMRGNAFRTWLRGARRLAETRLRDDMAALQARCLAELLSAEAADEEARRLGERVAAEVLGPANYYNGDEDHKEACAALNSLCADLRGRLVEAVRTSEHALGARAEALLERTVQAMHAFVQQTAQQLHTMGEPGVAKHEVETALNGRHCELATDLASDITALFPASTRTTAAATRLAQQMGDRFVARCVDMQRDVEDAYNTSANAAFTHALEKACDALTQRFFQLAHDWDARSEVVSIDAAREEADKALEQVWQDGLNSVRGWMGSSATDPVGKQHPFVQDLKAELVTQARPFLETLANLLSAENVSEADEPMDVDGTSQSTATNEPRHETGKGAAASGVPSVAEQRRRAKEWAQRTLTQKRSTKTAAARHNLADALHGVGATMQQRKSVAEQRAAAREYARTHFQFTTTGKTEDGSPLRKREVQTSERRRLDEMREQARKQHEERAKQLAQQALAGRLSVKKKR